MNARWQALLGKIDALTLRERFFLLVSAMVCTVALIDTLWLTPADTAHRQWLQRHQAQAAELTRLRSELTSLPPAQASGPANRLDTLRAQADATDARLRAVDADIASLRPTSTTGPELEQLLTQLLRRQDGLTLVGMQTLGPQPGKPAAPAQRGLELQISGPYAELVRYVRATEQALPDLRWGPLQLQNPPSPARLTLRLYVLGDRP
jgi:MSHA biogenesis protein MshJ